MRFRPAPKQDTEAQRDRKVGHNAGLSRRRSRVRVPSAPLRCPKTEDLSPAGDELDVELDSRRTGGERLRLASLTALDVATCARIRALGRWRPGDLRELMHPGSMPSLLRVAQLIGGAP